MWTIGPAAGQAERRAPRQEHVGLICGIRNFDASVHVSGAAGKPKAPQKAWLLFSCKSNQWLDYLGFMVAQTHPRMIHNKEGYRPQFEKFRQSLMSKFQNESNINTRAKHLWMAKYFNSVIADAPEGSGIDWSGLAILTWYAEREWSVRIPGLYLRMTFRPTSVQFKREICGRFPW